MRRTKITASFDELIRNHYGTSGGTRVGYALRLDDLFAGYYGVPAARKPAPRGKTAVSLSYHVDDGETIPARRDGRGPAARPPKPADIAAEYRVEIVEPVKPAATPLAAPVLPAAATPALTDAADDDFVADLESILKGKKVFDPASKAAVDRAQAGPLPPALPAPPAPPVKSETAIFDRIAQSLQYANAYNLGTIELDNRFADFDAIAEIEQRAPKARKAGNATSAAGALPTIDIPAVHGSDFISDLDAIRTGFEQKAGAAAGIPPASPTPAQPATTESQTEIKP